ncbi:MAG TPA: rod shape-determining protein MreC [Thermoanaerobaculia bacterium]|nr:rod shape-determining protein MreC [Thermoanaerobaculia bacterium]
MSERRTAWLLFVVLVAQLIVLSLQAPSPGAGGNFLENLLLRLVAPVTHSVAAVSAGARGAQDALRSRDDLARENATLRRDVERLELEVLRLSRLEQEMERLGAALDYSRATEGRLRVADVVYADHSSWLRTLILYTGENDAERNQPVISDAGLVGRVVEVVPGYAKVQLVTDRAAAVGAMVRRTRRQGVVRSGRDGLELDFLPRQADVQPGDQVVTSGIDGIYPRGLPLGRVVTVDEGDELFLDVTLAPAVDFGSLDQVYLLPPRAVPVEDEEG